MQKVQIVLLDDMTGTEADETVTFGLDGNQFEIDLTAKNAAALRKALTPYVEAARKVQGRRGRPRATENAKAVAATSRKGGTRKRTTTVEEIEKAKAKA
jgi:hypothetical protein